MATYVDAPVPRLRAALAALHPSARYVRVEVNDLEAALDGFERHVHVPAYPSTCTGCEHLAADLASRLPPGLLPITAATAKGTAIDTDEWGRTLYVVTVPRG